MAQNDLINEQSLHSFPHFFYTIGILPTSYKISLTYEEQLEEIMKFLRDELIPKFNNNAAALGELQEKFVELVEYVNEYFENLDIQTPIDNKLDEMVEDGTIEALINQEIFGELNDEVSTLQTKTATLETQMSSVQTNVEELNNDLIPLKKANKKYQKLKLPNGFTNDIFKRVGIYYNGYKFKADPHGKDYYKNTVDSTKYVAVDGSNSNDGSEANPVASISKALTLLGASGGTVIVKPGVYDYNTVAALIQNPANIIAQEPDTVLIYGGTKGTWSATDGYTNVYENSLTNVLTIFDVTDLKTPIEYKAKTSIADVEAEEGTYYIISGKVYVHMINNVTPTSQNCCVIRNGTWNVVSNNTGASHDVKIYMKNFTIIGGTNNNLLLKANDNSNYKVEGYFENIKSLFSKNGAKGIKVDGAEAIFENCVSNFNADDGFSYHNGSKAIEINCQGAYNGDMQSSIDNGSTAHDGSKVIRINGQYNNNVGPNIADVQENTLTMSIDCTVFDSESETSGQPFSDFSVSQGSATMYVVNCYTKYSSSRWQLYIDTDTTNNKMYVFNNTFDTNKVQGTPIEYTPELYGEYYISD